jgi:indolepyruvate ferredoxin oxidoreductase, alpha subunit
MAERSFKKEVQKLRLGDGEEFHGEGILAVTKALWQSGVSYVAGYQGAPISHLMDVRPAPRLPTPGSHPHRLWPKF